MNVKTLIPLIGLLSGAAVLAQEDPQKSAAKAAVVPPTPVLNTQQTYQDIRDTLGLVPQFMKIFPASAIPGAWQEMKSTELSANTQIPGKFKELIGLAVASQIPCRYCTYFHTEAAKLNGLTDDDIREAIALSAQTRRWSAIINGLQVEDARFRSDADQIAAFQKKKLESPTAVAPPSAPSAADAVTTAQKAYDDIQKTLGLVPDFVRQIPPASLPGAWNEYKALNLNPSSRIPQKYKDLIGLAVDSQIPCASCIYFDTAMAKVDGASPLEISEAVQMAALTRHWSTVLNGSLQDDASFRRETGQIMTFLRRKLSQTKQMGGKVGDQVDDDDDEDSDEE